MTEPPHEVIIFAERAPILVAAVGAYIILINGGELELRDVTALRKAFERVTSKGRLVGRLTVLEPTTQLRPPADMRAHVVEVIATFQHAIACTAILYEGTGFKATGVRSVATAIHLASRSTSRQRIFAQQSEACTWLTQSLPASVSPDATRLTNIVEQLRVRARQTLSPDASGANRSP